MTLNVRKQTSDRTLTISLHLYLSDSGSLKGTQNTECRNEQAIALDEEKNFINCFYLSYGKEAVYLYAYDCTELNKCMEVEKLQWEIEYPIVKVYFCSCDNLFHSFCNLIKYTTCACIRPYLGEYLRLNDS